MKQILLFFLFLCYSILGWPQKPSYYACYGGFYHSLKIVAPQYVEEKGGIFDNHDKYTLLREGHFEKWLKKFNNNEDRIQKLMDDRLKEDPDFIKDKKRYESYLLGKELKDYVFYGKSIFDTNAYIIIPRKMKDILESDKSDLSLYEWGEPRLKNEFVGNFLVECFLTKNHHFKYKSNTGQALMNSLAMKASYIISNKDIGDIENLNGIYTLQFYDESKENPLACYFGNLKNGMPDGFGVFMRLHSMNGHILNTHTKDDNRIVFFVRQGFWKAGVFTQESESNDLVNDFITKLNFKDNFGIDSKILPKIKVLCAKYDIDSLNPDASNRCKLLVSLVWDDVQIKTSSSKRMILMDIEFEDFFHENATMTILNTDDETKSFRNAKENKTSIFQKAYNLANSYSSVFQKDDYVQFNYNSATLYWDKEYCSGYNIYLTDYYRNLEVSIRSQKNADWETAGVFKIVKDYYDCNFDYMYHFIVPPALGHTFSNPYDSKEEAFEDIYKFIKEKHPSPKFDYTIPKEDSTKNSKFELLKERIKNSPKYSINLSDPFRGIWFEEESKSLFFVENSLKKKVLLVTKETLDKENFWGYFTAIRELGSSRFQLDKVSIHSTLTKTGFYRGNDKGETVAEYSGYNLNWDADIKEITRDFITFSDGKIWQRL